MPPYTIEQYLHVHSAHTPEVSPDGGTLTYLSDAGGVFQIWALDLKTGETRQMTHHDDKIGYLRWTARGEILFTMDDGGNERTQFHRIAADGTETRLTRNDTAIHSWGGLSPDGRTLVYAANPDDPAHMAVYALDLAVPDAPPRRLVRDEGYREVRAISPDGTTAVVLDARNGLFSMELLALDLAGGATRPIAPHDGNPRYASVQWHPDGRHLYCVTDQGRDFLAAARLDPATGILERLYAPNHDVEVAQLSPDGRHLALVTNVDGYSRLSVLEVATGANTPAPAHPPGVIEHVRWHPDGTALVFDLDGATHPPDVHLWQLGKGQTRRLTHSDRAGIGPDGLVEPTLVHYPAEDGRSIPAFLYAPRTPPPPGGHPAVIVVHGGPEAQFLPQYRADVQYLVQCGYAVLAPNVRGSTGYGNAYRKLDDRCLRMDSVRDLRAGRLWLGDRADIDADRIAVFGRSYGGFMVLAVLTEYPDLWAAGVEFFGIANWITFFERTGPWRRKLRAVEYGDPETDRDLLVSLSPIHKADRITAPLFVAQGLNDPRVPPHESELIVRTLRDHGTAVEFMTFADEGHGFHKLSNRIAVFGAVAAFLDRHV